MTIMDDKNTNEKRLSMDEILKNLLSCSERVSALEKVVHVYDPKELQSGWRTVISNPKYIACPEKRERGSPSVKSSDSSSCSTQKRNASKEKRKDFRQESVSVKFNKYESLGVLSYGVPSWRTIVDPETCTYLKRNHPCYFNDAVTWERNRGLTFLDPGGALDQHLGSFVKRQRENNNALQSHLGDKYVGSPSSYNCRVEFPAKPDDLSQNSTLLPGEGLIRQPLRPKDIFHPGINITAPVRIKPEKIASVPRLHISRHPKPGIHNSCIPFISRKELPPLLTSNRVVAIEKNIPGKRQRNLARIQQLKTFPSPFMPVSFQIVKQGKQARADQKLNWLPITSTTPCVPRHISVGPSDGDDPETLWSRTAGLVHNPITKAITHLKSQIPVGSQRIALTQELKICVPSKILELPLTSTGLN